MKIVEIFRSIQGEGPSMGRPSIFVRLAGCNLVCEGCDTNHQVVEDLTVEEVVGRIRSLCQGDIRHVVITGGEPGLQVDEVLELAKVENCDLETNGVIAFDARPFRTVVVSPKKGVTIDLNHWLTLDHWLTDLSVVFKFVVGPVSVPWTWQEIPLSIPAHRVWVMPYGTTPELENANLAWELALKHGYNYSDRLHIRVGGK